MEINGLCDDRFTPVREALADNFRERDELGAAVAVVVDSQPVVDLWAGWADVARTRRWERDTQVAVFSVGKAMATVCLLMLVEHGAIALDTPVAAYWPRFATKGKGETTVRMLLAHRAGLPAIRRALPDDAPYDWELMTGALAEEEPWWQPGAAHGYHVNTFGFLVGELVRRAAGTSIGTFFRREVAAPLAADFHFGFGREHDPHTAEFTFSGTSYTTAEDVEERQEPEIDDQRRLLLMRTYLNPPGLSGVGTVNTRAWRAAEIPSANGHATARGVARIYSALAAGGAIDGFRLLSEQTIDEATAEASSGEDLVLGRPSRFGLGFQLTQPERSLGPSARSFGHFGAGGSLGFADPDARLSFGYVMNRSGPRWQNPRNRALIDAVYESLAG